MNDVPHPQVPRRRLRVDLRNAREAAGLTQDDVARAMEWSLSKIIRIEAGSVGVSSNDLKALLRLYKITDQGISDELLALARQSRERSWWSSYKDVLSRHYTQFIDYESAATSIQAFQPTLVPGLLQTEEYARITIAQLAESPKDLDNLVEIRMKRQELLHRQPSPTTFFVIDEAVVKRVVGGRDVMRRQIDHLIATGARRNVTVELVPFTAGVHPGMQGPFVIMQLPEPVHDDVLYLEGSKGSMVIIDDPEDVASYQEKFEQLHKLSMNPADTAAYLRKIAEEMN
jgi:transcriptional regulator with XRE-family HTH domain